MRVGVEAHAVEGRGEDPVEHVEIAVPVSEADARQPVELRPRRRRLRGERAREGAGTRQVDVDAGRPQSQGKSERESRSVNAAQQSSGRTLPIVGR